VGNANGGGGAVTIYTTTTNEGVAGGGGGGGGGGISGNISGGGPLQEIIVNPSSMVGWRLSANGSLIPPHDLLTGGLPNAATQKRGSERLFQYLEAEGSDPEDYARDRDWERSWVCGCLGGGLVWSGDLVAGRLGLGPPVGVWVCGWAQPLALGHRTCPGPSSKPNSRFCRHKVAEKTFLLKKKQGAATCGQEK